MNQAEPAIEQWTQPWIWLDRFDAADSCALLARKTFSLKSVPAHARLRISANHIYRLYLNGNYIGRGPDRSDPQFPYFDTYEVNARLQPGTNILLVLVYHCRAEMRTWALYGGAGGLTLDLSGENVAVASDETWKITPAEAWKSTRQRNSKFRGPVFSVDLGGFEQLEAALNPDYDDSAWSFAQVRSDVPGNVLPAEIPPLVAVDRLPVHSGSIRSAIDEIKWADPRRGTFFSPQEMVVYPGEKGCWLVYDFGRTMGGFPIVEFDCTSSGKVDLHTGESLSWLAEDLLTLSDRGPQQYECLDWRGARYVALHFYNLGGPVSIRRVMFREMVYPFEDRGDFNCSDQVLDKVWHICRDTARINVKDHPVDCCGREQALWLADLTIHCRALSSCFGDLRPMEKAVKQVLRVMHEDGLVPVPGPAARGYQAVGNVLPWAGQGLHLSLILHELHRMSGRLEPVQKAMPHLEKLHAFFARYEDARGFLDNRRDSLPSPGFFCGWNPMQKDGIAAGPNFEYILSLEASAELAAACGETHIARAWKEKAARIRAAAIAAFWDPERCVFIDGEMEGGGRSPAVSITVNALAALAGAVDPALRGAWADFLRRNAGVLPPVSPLDASLLLEAYAALDLDLHFRELLDTYFGGIAKAGEPTLPEFWSHGVNGSRYWSDLSRCHAYGTAPAYLLPRYVLGARPLSPGWRQMVIEPRHIGLTNASGRIPVPQGDISIQWRREMLSWSLQVEIPEGVTAEVRLPKLGWGNQRLWHNGTLVDQLDGWPDFAAHAQRRTKELSSKKLSLKLQTPGRHYVETEAF